MPVAARFGSKQLQSLEVVTIKPPNADIYRKPPDADTYREFDATELYCARCKTAVPVRKRLLLVLPEGDKYEYLCAYCSASVGTKMDRTAKPISLIV